ncbi:hypothetical protein FQA39_LY11893 [Lamprigera yunnana]|nr:hypothetical protein FQA39_LY11893 [Lamprigera yunnana]
MEAIPVTLIVKAPNQQIEDQTIKCELSWTINKLKQHLSEVYPSKPPKHEQKLIYSGQLLQDSVILGDILRQYDGQETHTVHLVCATKRNTFVRTVPPTRITPTMPDATTSPQVTPTNNNSERRIPHLQWDNVTPAGANQYAMQMAWMQHVYMQYMTHYMNVNINGGINTNPVPQETPNGEVPEADNAQVEPAQQPRDPENPDRDWLDAFYIFTRAVIFISILYFYSSLIRFVFVLGIGFVIYLYQIGFFRNFNNNNNNHNNNNANAGQDNIDVQNPSVLTIVWTFFTTFFASLMPEIPQPV